MLSSLQIKKILKKENLKTLKSLGQNFLVDENVLQEIVEAAKLDNEDVVLEVGPGFGVLTEELCKKCKKVIAVEKDRRLAKLLKKRLNNLISLDKERLRRVIATVPNRELRITNHELRIANTEIINDDILRINIDELVKKYIPSGKYKLVSNIPYYITSPIIKLFLESKVQPELIILLTQKEVAQRICAKVGNMSILALGAQIYGKPEIVGYVDKSSFYPEPKVDSAILKIKNIKRDFSENYRKNFFRIVKIGFSAKRKKLLNNLAGGLHIDKEEAKKILLASRIDPNCRAQELDLEDWKRLTEDFKSDNLKLDNN